MWGVASWENRQRDGSSPWTASEFYALGESDWQDFLRHWEQYGIDYRTCLEIGCGAGRITKQLVTCFDRVYAVDVSNHMIDCARDAVGSGSVEYSIIDGLHLPQGDCSVTSIFSTHVLQHLDNVKVGFSLFREFFRVLEPGGTIMIHLPLYQFPGDFSRVEVVMRLIYAASRRFGGVLAGWKRCTGVKMMRRTPYSIQSLSHFLSQLGFTNVQFRIFPVKSNADPHPFVFATRQT